MAMNSSEWELSKENVQPIKQGRKLPNLTMALTPSGSNISDPLYWKMQKDKQSFEAEIRTYEGEDFLDVWYRYILWTEEHQPKGGREIPTLLERCIRNFQEENKYHNDERFLNIWLKYIGYTTDPCEIFNYLHTKQMFSHQALLYVSWASTCENMENFQKADQVLILGIERAAQPQEMLQKYHNGFQCRLAAYINNLSEDEESNAFGQNNESRKILGFLKTADKKRTTIVNRGQSSQKTEQLKYNGNKTEKKGLGFTVLQDNEVPTSLLPDGCANDWKEAPTHSITSKENFAKPGKWSGDRPLHRKPSSNVSSFVRPTSTKPPFHIHVEDNADQVGQVPQTVFGTKVLSERKSDVETSNDPLKAISNSSENSNSTMERCRYDKSKVYTGAGEFQFEEIRAAKYFEKLRRGQMLIKDINKSKREMNQPSKPVMMERVMYPKQAVYAYEGEFQPEELRARLYYKRDGRFVSKTCRQSVKIQNDCENDVNVEFVSEIPRRSDLRHESDLYTPHISEDLLPRQNENCNIISYDQKCALILPNSEQKIQIYEDNEETVLLHASKNVTQPSDHHESSLLSQNVLPSLTSCERKDVKKKFPTNDLPCMDKENMVFSARNSTCNQIKNIPPPTNAPNDENIPPGVQSTPLSNPLPTNVPNDENIPPGVQSTPLSKPVRAIVQSNDISGVNGENNAELGVKNECSLSAPNMAAVDTNEELSNFEALNLDCGAASMVSSSFPEESNCPPLKTDDYDSLLDEQNEIKNGLCATGGKVVNEIRNQTRRSNCMATPKHTFFKPDMTGPSPTLTTKQAYADVMPWFNTTVGLNNSEVEFENQFRKKEEDDQDEDIGWGGDPFGCGVVPFTRDDFPRSEEFLHENDENVPPLDYVQSKVERPIVGILQPSIGIPFEPLEDFEQCDDPSFENDKQPFEVDAEVLKKESKNIFDDDTTCDTALSHSEFTISAQLASTEVDAVVLKKESKNIFDDDTTCDTALSHSEFTISAQLASTPFIKNSTQQPEWDHIDCSHIPPPDNKLTAVGSEQSGEVFLYNNNCTKGLSPILEQSDEHSKTSSSKGSNTCVEDPLISEATASKTSDITVHNINGSVLTKINPFDPVVCNELLSLLPQPVSSFPGYFSLIDDTLEKFNSNKTVKIGDNLFKVKAVVGSGAHGKVFTANRLNENDPTVTISGTVALKVQRPANDWEFYICSALHTRLTASITSPLEVSSVMKINNHYSFSDGSCSIMSYHEKGTFLDFVNKYKEENWIKEVVALHYAVEMMRILNTVHDCGIIHGDVKPDNFIILSDDEDTEQVIVKNLHRLCLIDFGRSIDVRLFPPGTRFSVDNNTDSFECIEMKTGRPWTTQVDTYGMLCSLHCFIFGQYMKVLKDKRSGKWNIVKSFKRSWNRSLWEKLFDTFLNVPSCDELPSLSDMRQEFCQYLDHLKNDVGC